MMSNKKVSALQVGKWMINRVDREAGDSITHLKLQKVIYYAQAWHLANFNDPLFVEDIQAWTHGPVAPSVWKAFREYRWDHIPPQPLVFMDATKIGFLETVFEIYGRYTAKELEKITHQEDPWKVTRGDLPLEAKCTRPIDKKVMRDFYAPRIFKEWQEAIQ